MHIICCIQYAAYFIICCIFYTFMINYYFSNPKSVEAREASKKETKADNKLEKLAAENEHLKSKIDIMASEAREMQKLIDTKSSRNVDNEKFENVTNELQEGFIFVINHDFKTRLLGRWAEILNR